MKIKSLATDRKKIVKAIEQVTGEDRLFLGAPSFNYQVGPYLVDKEGNIEVDDEKVSESVIDYLAARELINAEEIDEYYDAMVISLPMEGHTGNSLKNLVFMFYQKGVLLSKVVGRPGFYQVPEEAINIIDAEIYPSVEAFLERIESGELPRIRGIRFEDGKVQFLFPCTEDPDRIKAYTQLSEMMDKCARAKLRVRPTKSKVTNEKFTLRTWVTTGLGMAGVEYRQTRITLMENLSGNSAFRTKDQAEAFKEKMRTKRAKERERSREMDFDNV